MTSPDNRRYDAWERSPGQCNPAYHGRVEESMAHARRMEARDGIPPELSARWDETMRGLVA